jgi:hypothetical protein
VKIHLRFAYFELRAEEKKPLGIGHRFIIILHAEVKKTSHVISLYMLQYSMLSIREDWCFFRASCWN